MGQAPLTPENQGKNEIFTVNRKGFIIVGTHSGVGKTTITLGIMAYLKSIGLKVQGFKVGPDFIDPGHHQKICGEPSHNLDTWMLRPWYNKKLFENYSKGADICVVEGVMGVFDGFSPTSEIGSTAHLAKILGLPVILVIDASSMARSVAAVAKGFIDFDKNLKIVGIFFNRVGSNAHIDIIKSSIKHYTNIPCFGFFKKQKNIELPSRHLGLVTAEEDVWNKNKIDILVEWTKNSITTSFNEFIENQKKTSIDDKIEDINGIQSNFECKIKENKSNKTKVIPKIFRKKITKIAVARDRAFCFYYENNLDLLKYMGAEITYFSPLNDRKLPPGTDGIYIGGGYPELYLDKLSKNKSLLKEIKNFIENSGVVYAECGGFMYLMKEISTTNTSSHGVVGIFPFKAHLTTRLISLGYRKVRLLEDCPLGPKGIYLKGHEFHYSVAHGMENYSRNIYKVETRDGKSKNSCGFRYKNCIGSYIHLHFGSNILCAKYFVRWCNQAC